MARKKSKVHNFNSQFLEANLNWDGNVTIRSYKYGEEILIQVPFNAIYGFISSTKKIIIEMQDNINNLKENMKSGL